MCTNVVDAAGACGTIKHTNVHNCYVDTHTAARARIEFVTKRNIVSTCYPLKSAKNLFTLVDAWFRKAICATAWEAKAIAFFCEDSTAPAPAVV